MHVDVNAARLWFDVDGSALVPDEDQRARPLKNLELNAPGMEVVRRTGIVHQLAAITSPTLVAVGELDPVTPVAAAEEIVAALPAGLAQLEIISGAGHWAWKDVPERFWPMIVAFIQSTTGREAVEA